MNTLLVGYDLRQPTPEYGPLIEALQAQGGWWHHLDSTWLVRTPRSAKELRDALLPFIKDTDEILVIDVTGRPAAWTGFQERAATWIKQNL